MEQYAMLEARIAKLEHRLRLVLVGWISTLALAVAFGLGVRQITAQPAVFHAWHIQAEQLEIVDQEGRPRIRLAMFSHEAPALVVPDVLPGLRLYDSQGRKRAQLLLSVGGDPYLELYDPNGQTGAHLSMLLSIPNLVLSDPRGRLRVSLGLGLGNSALSFHDSAGRLRIQVGLLPGKNEPYFEFLDSRERVRALLDVSGLFAGLEYESPRVALYDSQRQARAVLTLFPDESAQLGLFDSAGKILFRAP
jgi:hypothetical protein